MEDPTNLMMITGIFIFDEPVDYERLKATLELRFVKRFRRFRQRVVAKRSRFGRPTWVDDPNFDLATHLRRIALPAPGDRATLQEVVSDFMSTPLDFSKPLWQMHLIEGYEGRSVLMVRLHHCIADGIALVQVLLSLTDAAPDAPWPQEETRVRPPQGWDPLAPIIRPAQKAVKLTRKAVRSSVQATAKVMRDPEQIVEFARVSTDVALTTGRLLLLAPDPKTPYKGKLGVPKRVAWSDPVPLEDVRLIGRAAGGTINDVVMSAAAGAMRRYLDGHGAPVTDLNFRAVIPVNLRPIEKGLELGNRFGLVFLSLPIGIDDPVERLRELKRRMDGLKDTSEPIVAFGILSLIGMLPDRLEDVVVEIFGKKGTLVMTNVPGPREQLYFAGAPIGEMMFWVPQSGRLGLGISILSYNGQVMLGVASDQGLVPDPEAIVAGFHQELAALKAEARQRLMDIAVKFNIPLAPEAYDADMTALIAATEAVIVEPDGESAEQTTGDDQTSSAEEPFSPMPDGDDLTIVHGIGPSFARQLQQADISSFAALAASTPDALAAAIAVPDWRRPDFESWIAQAQTLADK
jgi:WS/DGAT/MGAT family acyltransferase